VTEEVLARTHLERRISDRTTELKRAEENLRALNQELMLAQDEERRRRALELHDSVGQSVAALQWKLVSAQENVYDSGEATAGYIAACLGLTEDISKEIRTISHLLHPPLLDEAGLSRALHLYIEGMREERTDGISGNRSRSGSIPAGPRNDGVPGRSGSPDEYPSPRPDKRGFRSHLSRVNIPASRDRRSGSGNCELYLMEA
jgi:hypothetical protein